MTNNKISQIILGAGRPFYGEQSSSLRKVSSDTRVLDWTLQAAKYLDPEVHFVAGYQIDEIVSRYPQLSYTINPEWRDTGPIVSLLEAKVQDNSRCIVSYGDILFRERTVKELLALDSDIAIAVDSIWKQRYISRSIEDIDRSEKVYILGDNLINLDTDSIEGSIDAEFIGLLSFKPEVFNFIQKQSGFFKTDMRKDTLLSLLEFLQQNNFSIKVTDVKGDWAELNEANDLANFILGTKAQSLKRLEDIITLSKIAPQISFTVEEWKTDSKRIVSRIQTKFENEKVIVRSSAISEDGFDSSNAGAYESVLDIDASVEDMIIMSINTVINSYPDKELENQVLVQPMIQDVSVSGVIFTKTLSERAPYYVINFDDSSNETDTITSGVSNEHKTLIALRKDIEDFETSVPKNLKGLIPAIQEIEKLLDFNSLDIEFAIGNKGEVNILQVRPLAANKHEVQSENVIFDAVHSSIQHFRDLQIKKPFTVGNSTIFGVMPDWNPAEIIGTKPNRLSFDLYRYLITDEVWATQRAQYGYRDIRPHALLVSFSGLPYVDVRASFNSFIPGNLNTDLAERLVEYYLQRLKELPHFHDKVEFEIVPTCFSFNFEIWEERLSVGGFLKNEIEELRDSLCNITIEGIKRTPHDLETVNRFRKNFKKINESDLPPLDKALTLLEDCQRYGTLVFSHLARSAFISVTLLKSAVEKKVISQEAMDSFMNSIETVAHEFVNDAREVASGKKSWKDYVNRYGHLRPGTYDITSEAYADNVEKYLRPVVEKARQTNNQGLHTKQNIWLNEKKNFFESLSKIGIKENPDVIEAFLRGSIEGREYAKFIFSRNLSAALNLFIEVGKSYDLDATDMSNVTLSSLFDLRAGIIGSEEASKRLKSESSYFKAYHDKTSKIELPALITNETDFHIFSYPSSQPNYVGTGKITAELINMVSKNLIEDNALDGKILLIPQADPGFDWIFGHNIAGLVTMYGGGNSHMAIRAKEFGLPAAIGVGEALYNSLASASIIELDVTNRKIEAIG